MSRRRVVVLAIEGPVKNWKGYGPYPGRMDGRAIKSAVKSAAAGVAMALCLTGGAAAGTIQIVSAHEEFSAAHPERAARHSAATASGEDFRSTMNRVFGPGRWRQTSGYRTQAQEDALRRQGAGTVAPGRISHHSIGGVGSPGAYDAVVDSMSLGSAAARLKQAGGSFSRVLAEGAHGGQGAHLHIELIKGPGAAPAAAASEDGSGDSRRRRTRAAAAD
jgi:hypothetical protein